MLGWQRKRYPATVLEQHWLEAVGHVGAHDAAVPVLRNKHIQALIWGAPGDIQDLLACGVAPLREACKRSFCKLSLDSAGEIDKGTSPATITQARSSLEICGNIQKIDVLHETIVLQELQKLRLMKGAG